MILESNEENNKKKLNKYLKEIKYENRSHFSMMAEDILDSERDLRRFRMREFYQLSHILFTKPERLILYKVLKDYRRRRDIERLVMGLKLVLRTYTKLELLKYVRYFIWEGHLVEFDRMTQFHTLFRKRRRKGQRSHHHSLEQLSVASATTSTGGRQFRDVRVFTLRKEPGETTMGFSVRGGSEHGLGMFVSEIEADSGAEQSGLMVGDKILEANNISLKGVASSSAVKVLIGSSRLKLVIQRTKKVPEWRLSREKTSWYDVHDQRLISGEFEECGITHHIRGLDTDVPERRVNLKFAKTDKTLGFNIRGGREYGLGIYVSKMDVGGLADENGVRVGDQIIDVNGIPFENITHAHAVEILKGKPHLVLTLRDVGRFPVFKELYAEYTWSDGQLRTASSLTNVNDIYEDEEMMRNKGRSMSELFSSKRRPSALQSEIFLPSQRPGSDVTGSRERFNDEIAQDDSDSLINLEQWAQAIKDTGDDNHGYVSDSELDNNVIVHVQDVDDTEHGLPDIYTDTEQTQHTASYEIDNCDIANGSDDEETNYAAADMIYAKISKHDQVSDSVSNFSLSSKVQNDKQNPDETKRLSVADSEQITGLGTGYASSENRVVVTSNGTESASIDGALYSQVRRLSGGTILHTGQARQTPSGSQWDIADEQNTDTNTIQNKYEQTLQIRKHSVQSSDNSVNSDDEDIAIVSSHNQYNVQTQNAVDTDHDDDDYAVVDEMRAFGTTEHSGRPNLNQENSLSLDVLEERLKELEKRQTSIGVQELNTLSTDPRDGGPDGSPSHKKGKWKSFKNKIKGSLRIKSSKRAELSIKPEDVNNSGSVKKKGLFDRSFGRDITQNNTVDGYNMASLEDKARKMLNTDEFDAVMRHVRTYHDSHELERLVELLLVILDKPEKLLLLRDIRGVIYPLDMVHFDNLVNHYEIEAYQTLSMKLHLPLNHKPQRKPRRTLITTEIENKSDVPCADVLLDRGEAEDGHFHIKPIKQYDKQREVVGVIKEQMTESRLKPFHQQKSLDESSILNQFEYLDQEHDLSDVGSSLAAFSEYGSHGSSDLDRIPGAIIVHLSKNKPSLGIDFIEEDVNGQKEVIIQRIDPHGAANDDSTLEVGMTLLGVDRQKVEGYTVEETLAVLQKSYSDKQFVSMKLVLHKPQSTDM